MAGGGTVDEDEGVIAGINITPMVDIMLVLLIIFMLTASVIEDKSIKVELPQAATADKTEESILGITIDGDRVWYLNGVITTEDALRVFIRQERALNESVQAIIAADTSVPYGDVVKVIDLAKQEGVTSYALNTDPAAAQILSGRPDTVEPEEQE
jgi:biopolymer transport protein ExbD